MDPSRFSLAVFLVLLSYSCFVFGSDDDTCIVKLLPCQPFLGETTEPPAVCCGPLKEVVEEQKKCLCTVFNNEEFLKSFNLTQETALQLPKRCGVPVDINICKPLIAGGAPAAAPSSPPSPSGGSSNVPSQPGESGAVRSVRAYCLGAYGIVASMVALLFWAF